MDSLKTDLKHVNTVTKDLLTKLGGDLQVPSWRFPEKLATSLDPELVLKEREREDKGLSDNKLLVMELIADRLLFLLQCCVRLSDMAQGQRSTSLPLTLGSTVKKFSRRVQQDHTAIRDMTQKLSEKDQKITALESSITNLQSTVKQLQHTLHNTIPTMAFSTNPGTGQLDNRPASRQLKVPYEAQGTMKMNKLSSSVDLVSLCPTVGPNKDITALDQDLQPSKPTSISLNTIVGEPNAPGSNSVHTQTTETAFALCVRCSDTQNTLVDLATCVSQVSSNHNLSSTLSQTDWSVQAKVGGLEVREWAECFRRDLSSLDSHSETLEGKVDELVTERDKQGLIIGQLEVEIDFLSAQINELQVSIETVQTQSRDSLARTQKELVAQLSELKQTCSQLELANVRVREELSSSRKHEAIVKSKIADLDQQRNDLQREIRSIESREVVLLSSKQSLERELEAVSVEVTRQRDVIETNKLELSKTKVYANSIEKKNKSLISKQSLLLSRLDELDQECSGLRDELSKVGRERGEMTNEVTRIQQQCGKLKQELELEKDKLFHSCQEQERLQQVCSNLEEEVGVAKNKLDEEKEKCRLLMDYPFIKQTSERYNEHISSLMGKESQKQISANTVRILLLEEQNSELRMKNIKLSKEARQSKSGATQLRQPVPMWRHKLLTQVNSEQTIARQVSSKHNHPAVGSHGYSNERGSPSIVPNGRGFPSTVISQLSRTNERGLLTNKRTSNSATKSTRSPQRSGNKRQGSANAVLENTVSRPTPSRPSTSGSFKGRLGHLVAAIAEAHKSSDSSQPLTTVVQSTPHSNSEVLNTSRAELWVDMRQPLMSAESITSVDLNEVSANSSYGSLDVHMCRYCDRMYHSRQELEQHQTECCST